MARSLSERLADVHPQPLRVGSEGRSVQGEGDPQKVADLRPVIGSLLDRAIALMGRTKQEVAYDMGYSDAGTVSRWCSGIERPLFDKLIALDGFIEAWVIALTERQPHIRVETIVTIRRRA